MGKTARPLNLGQRMALVKPSATVAVTAKAAALRARGVDVVDLGAGEPDFDTAPHIREAASAAMDRGETRYTPVGGTGALKRAVCAKLERDNALTYAPDEVIASCGGKHSLYLAFHALFGGGEDVVVPAPFWVSYPDMLALAGARARIVRGRSEHGFKLRAAEIDEAITEETRAVILNSPSNPAGVTYDRGEVEDIAAVLAHRDVIVICDDVYEMISYGVERFHVLSARPDLRERTVVVNSVSKTYAMTGWRLGYAAGPKALIDAMATLQGQMTSNPCSIAQAAAVAALSGPQDHVRRMVEELGRRRDFVVPALDSLPGVGCPRPQGAFYVFPNVAGVLRPDLGIGDGDDLAAYLLEKAHVALVGGTSFGYPEHVRISYANSMENLQAGVERIRGALKRLAAE